MKKTLLLLIIMMTYTSCLYAVNPSMPQKLSQKAEVMFSNASKKQIIDAITNEMISRGFYVKSIADYKAIYGKIDEIDKDWVMFGGATRPESRISYDIVETLSGIRVVANQQIVTNPNTNHEYITDFSYYKNVVDLQHDFLLSIKMLFEKK